MDADALLATPTYARARAALVAALGAGHRVVLLLCDHAGPAAGLLLAATRDLAPAGRAVHLVAARKLAPADLSHADHQVVVAIYDVHDCGPPELSMLDEALARPAGPQLLLSATPLFRLNTAAIGLVTLHLAPFVVHLPPLPDADAQAYLRALTGRHDGSTRRLAAAGGDPLLIKRLARRRLPDPVTIAALAPVAALLDRPAAGLAAALTLAAFAIAATIAVQPRPASHPALAPYTTQPNLPPTFPLAAPSGPFVSDDLADEPGTSQSDTGVTVSRIDPDDLLSPRLVAVRPGETLAALYRRAYRGLVAPPFAAIQSLNPNPLHAGTLVICPAPAAGWPGPAH